MKYGIIVGASSDIAQVCIENLKNRGFDLYLTSRNKQSLESMNYQWKIPFSAIDSYSFAEIEGVFAEAQSHFQGLAPSFVVCLSGSLLLKPVHLISEEDFNGVMEANLKAAFATVKSSVTRMQTEGGSIVLMSSVAANLGLANHEGIAAAKAGIEGLVRSAAATYARYKIRVNAVAPALTQTKLTQRFTTQEAVLKASQKMHPLGRIGTPGDISSAISFLVAEDSAWITGQTLHVDGGLSTLRTV